MSPLMEYVKRVMNVQIMFMRPPQHAIFINTVGVLNDQIMVSLVLDREGQFQTELFIAPPATKEFLSHTHPGVESYQCLVAGDFLFQVNGEPHEGKSSGQGICQNYLAHVPADAPHSAVTKNGASFLSFQHWQDGTPPSTIGHKFEIV